jgi:hypothetical protein
VIIVAGSMLFFGVSWGNPLGSAAVILSFSLVGTSVAILVGSLCTSVQQAQPLAFLLGPGLAALGGSMAPLEVFPATARKIAHVTPMHGPTTRSRSCSSTEATLSPSCPRLAYCSRLLLPPRGSPCGNCAVH